MKAAAGGGEGGQIIGAASDETAPPQRKYTPSIAPIGATEGAWGWGGEGSNSMTVIIWPSVIT